MASRKCPAIQIWPRKYYTSPTPQHREEIRLHNYRAFFLKSIEKQTPEVVDDLAYHIQPLYAETFWAECEQLGESATSIMFDNHVKYHKRYAHSWFLGSRDFWWDRYSSVRDELLAWAKYYNLRAEWVLKMALDAMGEWTQHFTHFDKFELVLPPAIIEERAQGMPSKMRSEYLEAMSAHEERVKNAIISWPVKPFTPTNSLFPPESRSFTYPKWDGFDERRYEHYIREKFDEHVKEYMREVEAMAERATKVEILTKPERFEMLALYLCRDKTPEEIGALKLGGIRKEKSGVFLDIQRAAKLVQIDLKKRGIAAGTKLKKRRR